MFYAALNEALRRLRPIVLTAPPLFGLAPMIFETSVQARSISPDYGILFTMVVILVLCPGLFLLYHNVRKALA